MLLTVCPYLPFSPLHSPRNSSLEPSIRCNLVVALGDLAVRFPNALEPWTSHMYAPLGDPDPRVRRRCVVVLSHLILSDMLKVKGHVAKLAMCMRAGEEPGEQGGKQAGGGKATGSCRG